MSTQKFAVGQKVVITKESPSCGYYHSFRKGEECEVIGTSTSGRLYLKNEHGHTQYIDQKDVQPAMKAGDKVRLISGGGYHPLYGFENGEVYTIKATPSEHIWHKGKEFFQIDGGSIYDAAGKGNVGYATAQQLEIVADLPGEEVEVEELREGDIFILVDPTGILPSWVKAEKEYTVTEIDSYGDPRMIDEDGDELDVPDYLNVTIRRIAANPQQTKRPTVGDIVVVIGNKMSHNYRVGETVKIEQDEHDNQPYKARRKDGTIGNWLHKDDVRMATAEEATAFKKPVVDPAEADLFKAGDKVQVKAAPYHGHGNAVGVITGEYRTNLSLTKHNRNESGFQVKVGALNQWIKAEDLELIPQPAELSKEGLAVGDTIVFTKSTTSYVTEGKHYKVKSIDHNNEATFMDDDGDEINVGDMGRKFVKAGDLPVAKSAKLMFLANDEADDVIDGKLYDIEENDFEEDGTVLITDEAGDTQWMTVGEEGKLVTVTFE